MLTQQGFSLLELLITLVIISLLMTFAIPNYTQHVTRERRIEAEIMLEKLASELEQYRLQQNSYNNATLSLLNIPEQTASKQYQISIDTLNHSHYMISATPIGKQAAADTLCGVLKLDEVGTKQITGTGNLNTCW